jgi:hypothetical protein
MDPAPFIVGYIVILVLCVVFGMRAGRRIRAQDRRRGGRPLGPRRGSGSDGGTYVPTDSWSGHMADGPGDGGGGGHGGGSDGGGGGGDGGGGGGGGD